MNYRDTIKRMVEEEECLLCSLMMDNSIIDLIPECPQIFREPINQHIYNAILDMVGRGLVATSITLKNYFNSKSETSIIGAAEYLSYLAKKTSSPSFARTYIRNICILSRRMNLTLLKHKDLC